MPRRPRSARAPEPVEKKRPNLPKAASQEHHSDSVPEDEDDASLVSEEYEQEQGEDLDVDAPRVAQWVDEEDLDALPEDEGGEVEDERQDELPANLRAMKSIQYDLSSLPFGTLRKAQQKIIRAETVSDSDSEADPDSDDNGQPRPLHSRRQQDSKVQQAPESSVSAKERHKRSSKHAPSEMSSKRAVTRRRTVVEVSKLEPRDPRFLSLSGEFDARRFRQQYNFLSCMHETELSTLRGDLKRANKLLASSPRDLREERAREVERLERAVKRAESTVNKDKKEQVEQSALDKVKQEEKEKQKQGKRAWYMKSSDRKELLTKARYEALSSTGGSLAVKKAIEKKQRKISQKEKKSRPFAPPRADGEGGRGDKRRRLSGSEDRRQAGRAPKRQRVG